MMSKLFASLTVALAAATGLPCAAAPLEAYGRLPAIETVVISPDGERLALAVTNGEQRKIVIEKIDPKEVVTILNAGEQKVRSLQWAGANHLLITVSSTGLIQGTTSGRVEAFVAADYDLTRKRQRPLLSGLNENNPGVAERTTLNILANYPDVRTIDGRPFAVAEGYSFIGNLSRLTLFKVDLERGAMTMTSQGVENTDGYLTDARGEPLAESDYDAPSGRWALRLWKGHWQEADHREAQTERPSLVGLGRDGASILVRFFEQDKYVLRELPASGGSWSDAVGAADAETLIWDPPTHKLFATRTLVGDEAHYYFFNPHDEQIWTALLAAYPGARVDLVSLSDDHRKFVLRVDSPTEGPALALVDLTTKKGRWIGDEYQSLKAGDIGPVRAIAFRARDGLPLTGYLTLPHGKDAKNLPLVVLPHGGPAVRDSLGFDWWAQALASRGYAVLQVNYRGSEGFGWGHLAAGFGQWGRKMETDLSDGVRFLAGQGAIDPTRVCIVGASYGGYAALAGATLDPGVYRCAASVSGLSNLRKFIDWGKARQGRHGTGAERYWVRFMGDSGFMDDISPAVHADKVVVPILLVHGKDDTVVPYEQSQIMADALRRAGKPVEFVTLKGEDHWLSRGETRLQMLQSVVAFFEKNNPP